MKERFRDKTRDQLTYALNLLGVGAEMAERGRAEEKIQDSWYQRSLGIIDIPEGPVRWINILKKDGAKDSGPMWWTVLGIPDDKLSSNSQAVKISTIRKKAFPLFGKVVKVTWSGADHGTGLTYSLSNDEGIKNLAKRIGNLDVRSYAKDFQGWTLQVDRRFEPTHQDWETIQQIADYLLSSPRGLY